MNTETPPQPAHGEPWPDAYEVHSKETMDEVREALEQMARRTNKGFTGCVYCNYVEEAGHSDICLVASALAKLNPPL